MGVPKKRPQPHRHEAAVMAAVLPNPVRRSARQPGAGVRRFTGIYLNRARRRTPPSSPASPLRTARP